MTDPLGDAKRLLGAVSEGLGTTAVIDLGMGPAHCADFVDMTRPVLTEWKLAVTFWFLCDREALKRKIGVLKKAGVLLIAGGTAGEIAAHRGQWQPYLELCQSLGFDRLELAEGFMGEIENPAPLIRQAAEHGMEVQYEVGRKNIEADRSIAIQERVAMAQRWADAGAKYFIIEARETGAGFAMFSESGEINDDLASELLKHFSLSQIVIEAPTRPMYKAVINHFGPGVCLGNIYPEELLRVESLRRAIHADTVHHQEAWKSALAKGSR